MCVEWWEIIQDYMKGSVLLQLSGKKVMIKDVHYVLCFEKNLLSISSIMKQSPNFHINFRDNRCFIVDLNRKKLWRNMVYSSW